MTTLLIGMAWGAAIVVALGILLALAFARN